VSSEGARTRAATSAPPPAHALVPALVLALLLATVPVALHAMRGEAANASSPTSPTASGGPAPQPRTWPVVKWRHSVALGKPNAGSLMRGVRLPNQGEHYFTWDFVLKRSPNRGWRRYGTDRLVRTLMTVVSDFSAAHPEAARVGIADLSRPRGGNFGPRFGGLGHASHQNGLDADVLYPRLDRLERAPVDPAQIDHALAHDLVDRFVRAGAQYVFVGPHTHLSGPPKIVQPLVYHDDHMHVRIRRH
jgi:murein endopeptidase